MIQTTHRRRHESRHDQSQIAAAEVPGPKWPAGRLALWGRRLGAVRARRCAMKGRVERHQDFRDRLTMMEATRLTVRVKTKSTNPAAKRPERPRCPPESK